MTSKIGRKYIFLILTLSFLVNFDSTVAIPIIALYAKELGA
ncbi:hypothetical protein LCGC14_1806910, partial [marine sediment metagenome]